ncbi:hypothetical protein M408DRAFT_28747 [Serendipita vermifera MAFF 305830]|uniref:Uncharacterized protein n=1 Tax=Serendipita vermifera MAFF 305830 TaxID=933852 RepID=A0A0C2W7C6_SERVB|nr:hypothetical protein M408DRAFT_28747 [Serendipita vermifera MAFF 305830]
MPIQDIDSLDLRPFDLGHFNRKANGIRATFEEDVEGSEEAALARWMEFGIAGINIEGGYRAQIHFEDNKMTGPWINANSHHLKARYDFDSFIGQSQNLPYTGDIELFPLFKSGFRIMKSLHIPPIKVHSDYLDPTSVSYAEYMHIPHVVLGHSSQRSNIILMLPGLMGGKVNSKWSIEQAILAELYDDCLYPAVIEAVHEGEAGHWLATYQAEMNRARKPNGQLQVSGKLIPKHRVKAFGDAFLELVQDQPWGSNSFFVHQGRGLRGATNHRWAQHQEKFDEFFSVIDQDLIDPRKWWIDVGIEQQCPGHILWWKAETIPKIIAQVLQTEESIAERLMKSKSNYVEDHPCQLTDIAGFRLVVDRDTCHQTGVAYIQAYNTEKVAVYQLSLWSNAHKLEPKDLLKKDFKIEPYSEKVAKIWQNSRDKVDGHARLEVRVRLSMLGFERPHLAIGRPHLAKRFLYQIPRHHWWDFKTLRLMSMSQAIRWWCDASEGKENEQAIALMVSLIYMINALNSTGRKWTAEDQIYDTLMKDVLIETEDTNVYGEYVAFKTNPLGIVFPYSVIAAPDIVPTPQLGEGMKMPGNVYYRLFDHRNLLAMQLAISSPRVMVSKETSRVVGRVRNQFKRAKLRNPRRPQRDEQVEVPDNIALFPSAQRKAPEDIHPGEQNVDLQHDDLSEMITGLVARSYMDLLMCSPNKRGRTGISYCRLKERERCELGPEVFKTTNLAKVWRQCIVKDGDARQWDQQFNRLFPAERRVLPATSQNYANCPFWMQWQDVLSGLGENALVKGLELQMSVKVLYDRLLWLPYTQTDRIWLVAKVDSTKIAGRGDYIFPDDYDGIAPVIIINPNWQGRSFYFDEDTIEEYLATKFADEFDILIGRIKTWMEVPNFHCGALTHLTIYLMREEDDPHGYGEDIANILPFMHNLQCLFVEDSQLYPVITFFPNDFPRTITLEHLQELTLHGGPEIVKLLGLIQPGPKLAILDIMAGYDCQPNFSMCTTQYLGQYLALNAMMTPTRLDYNQCCETMLDLKHLSAVHELGLWSWFVDAKQIVDIVCNDSLIPGVKILRFTERPLCSMHTCEDCYPQELLDKLKDHSNRLGHAVTLDHYGKRDHVLKRLDEEISSMKFYNYDKITHLALLLSNEEYYPPGYGQEILDCLPFLNHLQSLAVVAVVQYPIISFQPVGVTQNIVLEHLQNLELCGGPDVIQLLGFIQLGPKLESLDVHPGFECDLECDEGPLCITALLGQYLASNALENLRCLDYYHCCEEILDVTHLPTIQEFGLGCVGSRDFLKKVVEIINNVTLIPQLMILKVDDQEPVDPPSPDGIYTQELYDSLKERSKKVGHTVKLGLSL